MSSMGINGMRKPQAPQHTQQTKPQQPPAQAQKPNLSDMYSQAAQKSMKAKPHH